MINTLALEQKAPNVVNDLVEALGEPDTPEERLRLKLKIIDMNVHQAFDMYLRYNGIIGFTQDIIDALDALRACESNIR
jgi:hypothetical protein